MPRLLRLVLAAVIATVSIDAAIAGKAQPTHSQRLAAIADEYYESEARFDPITATLVGDNRFDDRVGSAISAAERRKRYARLHALRDRFARIDRTQLSAADTTTYDVLGYVLETRLRFEPFDEHLLPMEQMSSLPVVVANLGSGQAEQPLRTVAHYETYLKRIGDIPRWVDLAIANLREGMRKGVVQPKPIISSNLKQIRALADTDPGSNPFAAPARNFPRDFPEQERARLRAAYAKSVAERVAPAMRKLADFLERAYLPAGRDTVGWTALPRGAQWYRAHVREQTTMDLDPEDVHRTGLAEVARIRAEVAKVAPRLGFDGDPQATGAFFSWLRESDRFRPFKSEQEILDAYRQLNARIALKLPQLFGRRPKSPLDIRPEPELTRATASDHYSVPAPDGSRPGIFWTVITDPRQYNTSAMTSLFIHEGQPGHHFHLAMQQEMDLPRFRRFGWINAYGEGWALYAETLGKEMGLYEDDAAYAGHLRAEIARAARLVVDTGIHVKGWSLPQAMAYWRDNGGGTEANARSQIERYTAWPAQALGYKIGSLRIQQLREKASRALGDRFSLAAFHDVVLEDGSLPLALLEAKVDRWIGEQRAR